MEYRRLGNAGVKVSTLCLGGMTFGEADQNSFMHGVGSSKETSFKVLDHATEAGVNFIDLADVYGQDGLAERVFGEWMKEKKNRDSLVVATKFRFRMTEGPNGTGASRKRIRQMVEASLKRLQTDHIDLYQVHMQDKDVGAEELMAALDDLVRSGKVLYVGASNFTATRMVEHLWAADRRGFSPFVSMQMQYSLLERSIDREHIGVCERFGLGLLPWSPLAGGYLTGKYKESVPKDARYTSPKFKSTHEKWVSEKNKLILEKVEQIAKETSATASQVSLAWLISKPYVSSVIFGARTPSQLEENLKSISLKLSSSQVEVLDAVSAVDAGYPYQFIKNVQGEW